MATFGNGDLFVLGEDSKRRVDRHHMAVVTSSFFLFWLSFCDFSKKFIFLKIGQNRVLGWCWRTWRLVALVGRPRLPKTIQKWGPGVLPKLCKTEFFDCSFRSPSGRAEISKYEFFNPVFWRKLRFRLPKNPLFRVGVSGGLVISRSWGPRGTMGASWRLKF